MSAVQPKRGAQALNETLHATTPMFGTPRSSFSSDWLCVGPYPRRPPIGVRTTSGTVTWSSYISRNLEIPLAISRNWRR